MKLSDKKYERLEQLSSKDGLIAALAIDQRGSMRKMIPQLEGEERDAVIRRFKRAVAEELTPYATSILLDPVYGLEAIGGVDEDAGLILSYEVTGYRDDLRLPTLLKDWSALRLKDRGADAVKILLYYDVDDDPANNELKKIFIERVGSECAGEELPFFLEILTYDNDIGDNKSGEFAKVKPHKVLEAVKEFSKERYGVDVLKLEVPVNMDYVEGYGDDPVYSREEALGYFKEQSDATDLPFIFLSAGVSAEMFQETLRFAHEAGSRFNGVLCGRATWKGGVPEFVDDPAKGREWLKTTGKKNINDLNDIVKATAISWKEKIER